MINPAEATVSNTKCPARTADHTRGTPQSLLSGSVTDWFPLLPRTRPPAQALHQRVAEIRVLAQSSCRGPDGTRLSCAAEAFNKAALIASDCGIADLARQLCWRQFDLFRAAAPLAGETAKLALQPIVNLGRLATRSGDGTRAYLIFQNAYDAVTAPATTDIDGRDVDFRSFVNHAQERHNLRRFLWTILLADGTRALTTTGRWDDALTHLDRYKGVGARMLDGRQAAVLARCATADVDGALDMLDASSTPEPWEEAVAACMRTLCLRIANRPAQTSAAAMVRAYLRLEPAREHLDFRTRLGLCVIDLADDTHPAARSQAIARVIREAVVGADARSALDVLAHQPCRSSMAATDKAAVTHIVGLSGLRNATMPPNLLEDLSASVKASEAQLTQLLRSSRS